MTSICREGPGGSMSQALPNNSYKPITNTAWVRARLCKSNQIKSNLFLEIEKVDKQIEEATDDLTTVKDEEDLKDKVRGNINIDDLTTVKDKVRGNINIDDLTTVKDKVRGNINIDDLTTVKDKVRGNINTDDLTTVKDEEDLKDKVRGNINRGVHLLH